ncbi:hypothetical protein QVD17_41092 [Tagetes erecta]|uniref:Uncharacterized protein n=1 Tax=Tagetes erecta TaxID=13708 RepID=A0AAD8NB39_TARER|nr:hypothetical protein QVD17_41092 [Tagetes erecta]
MYHRLKVSCRRKRYERLGGNRSDQSNSRKRFWRIRITPKLKLKLKRFPKTLLIRIRDGYVNMMMRLANSPAVTGNSGYGTGIARFGTNPVKEYDDKVIIEFYKTILAKQTQFAPIDASHVGVLR